MISIITSSQGFANLKFSEKPTDEMRNELKSHGWVYSSRNNVWYPSTYSKERSAEGSQKFTQDFLKRFGGMTQTQKTENANFELEDIKSGKTVKTLAEIEDVTRQIAAKYKDELKASSKWMDFMGFNIEGGMGGDLGTEYIEKYGDLEFPDLVKVLNGEELSDVAKRDIGFADEYANEEEDKTDDFPFKPGDKIPLDTFHTGFGGDDWEIKSADAKRVRIEHDTDNIVVQQEAKEMDRKDFLAAVRAKHPELFVRKDNKNENSVNKTENMDELRNALKTALEEVAEPLPETEFTRENYNALFPFSKIETPIETVKMGAHQFENLEVKERRNILRAVHDVLSNPDLIINDERESVFGDMEQTHVYAKSFIINDKSKAVQSVVVSIEGENVSISSHERDISNVVNKIKKPDQLLFAAAKVGLLVERMTNKSVTVNRTRVNEYVIPPKSNIPQSENLSTESALSENDLKNRVAEWSSEKVFEEAEGLSRAEIFEKYGTEKLPIATIPKDYILLFENERTKIQDNFVYSSKGFFVDHMINHHPELDTQDYIAMQDIINNPENIYKDSESGNIVFSQIKNNKNDIVVLGTDNNKLVLYRSCFIRRKMPMKYELIDLAKVKEMSLEGSLSSSIKPSENQKSAVALSALNDGLNIPQSENLSTESEEIETVPTEMANQTDDFLNKGEENGGNGRNGISQMFTVMNDIANEELPEAEENFAYANEERENSPDFITEQELELFKRFAPVSQYVTTVSLLASGEEKDFYVKTVKDIAQKIKDAPGLYKTDGAKEHPLVAKYFHPAGTESFICEISKENPDEAFGFQVVNGDWRNAEWGYINLPEVKNIPGMELDYHLEDGISIERQIFKEAPEYFSEYAELEKQQEILEKTPEKNLTNFQTSINIMEESFNNKEQDYDEKSSGTSERGGNLMDSSGESENSGQNDGRGSGSGNEKSNAGGLSVDTLGGSAGRGHAETEPDADPNDNQNDRRSREIAGNSPDDSADSDGCLSEPVGKNGMDGGAGVQLGDGRMQTEAVDSEISRPDGGTERLRYGSGLSVLTKSQMKDVRSQVKEILERKKDGTEWTSSELALFRLYEGGGGLGEKNATSAEVLNAFYTPSNIVDAVWKLADSYAPNAVTVLEPSSGIGRFADNRNHNKFTLRELDETSSRIAKILHPDAEVIQGAFQSQFFDETNRIINKNYAIPKYDIVIGNPPYGEYSNEWKGRGEGKEHTRYDQYFIEKALDSLKDENSVVAFVIPSGTLNSGANKGKEFIAQKGVLIDAYRLPNGAFPTTQIGTDIVLFKKGRMNVSELCNNDFFERYPEKVLGEVSTRTGRYGEEYCVEIPAGETIDSLLTKIDSDIKKRGIDLNLIKENQSKKFLERTAEEKRLAEAQKPRKETQKTNLERLLEEAKKDDFDIAEKIIKLHKTNGYVAIKKFVPNETLKELGNKWRNWGWKKHYDIATKKGMLTYEDFCLAVVDENGIIKPAIPKEEFNKLSDAKKEKLQYETEDLARIAKIWRNNFLGIEDKNGRQKIYFKNILRYNEWVTVYDTEKNIMLSNDYNDCYYTALTVEKNENGDALLRTNLERAIDPGDIAEAEDSPEKFFEKLKEKNIYFARFETLFPENGEFNFQNFLDEIRQNELKLEEIPLPKMERPLWENEQSDRNQKRIEEYINKLFEKLVFEDSAVKSLPEFQEKALEKQNAADTGADNRNAENEAFSKQNEILEGLQGNLFLELSKMDFSKPSGEKFIDSYLVKSEKNGGNPNQTNVYVDQKRRFSVSLENGKINLISYNNADFPLSFVKAMYGRFGENLSVSDISPFEEKILNLDEIIKENQKKEAAKNLCEVAEKSLTEIFSDKELSENLIFESGSHSARIVQNGTHKKVFIDNSKYVAFDFDKITQKLVLNSEVYNLGLQNFAFEKAKILNHSCKITRDFNIAGKRYIDSDGKTQIAPPQSPRYNPKKEKLLNNKEFAAKYGAKWSEDERIFFEVSDGFGGYVNLSRLNEEQLKTLRKSKNYVEEYPGKFIHKEFYASGNIYNKLDKLDADFADGKLPAELYGKNKKILQKALPAKSYDAEISVLSSTLQDYKIDGEDIKKAFLKWASGANIEDSPNTVTQIEDYASANVKREEIPSTIHWSDVADYVNQEVVGKIGGDELSDREKTKLRQQIMNDRKTCAETLFARYLREGLSEEEKTKFWDFYNRKNHAYKSPDYSKLPLYVDGMNSFKNGREFKLYEQQIKGVSFLCNKGNGLLAYDVGVGKTAAGIVATVNQIQTGRAKKPLIIVPKAVIGQWESDIHELFPNVQINNLDNCSYDNIKTFYDGNHGLNIPEGSVTLITKEALNNISFSETTRDDMMKDFEDLTGMDSKNFAEMSAFEQEKYKEQLRNLFGKAEKVDNQNFLFWENCGFDNITVDEAHYYKNLFKVPRTKQANEFAGMGSGVPSKRAVKMFVITQQIQKQNNGRNVFLLTATPFTNSPSEIYSMLMYIARKEMENQGIKNFYDFCAKHIRTQYEPVVTPKGDVDYNNVIKSFNEIDALRDNLLNQFIDKVDGEEAGIIRPNEHVLLSKMNATPLQKEIFNFCTNQIMEYNPKSDSNPMHDDNYKRMHSGNIIQAINIMRAACLSPALVKKEQLYDPMTEEYADIEIPDAKEIVECSPKLKLVCDTVVKNWKENHTNGQVIFMPQGTEYYSEVIDYMAKKGVPREVFAEITGSTKKIGGKNVSVSKNEIDSDDEDGEGKSKISKISKAFNSKENPCKILIGSDSIKEGINLNGNSIALYNCMLGWNPSDATQAKGRIWRQGNAQGDVNIVYPLIYNSVDSLIYQKFDEKKSRTDSLWDSDGKLENAEINPAELKFELIKDPEKRAKIEINREKAEVNQKILNIQNSILNFKGYETKLAQLNETLKLRREQKAGYISNYQQSLFDGKELRSAEDQKKGIERFEKSIKKAENSILQMQKKIDAELNIGGKKITKEEFNAEKEKEIESLKKSLEALESYGHKKAVVEKYRVKLAEEAVLNLSEEEKNPLYKRIQENLRPAYFTEWERKNERYETVFRKNTQKISLLEKEISSIQDEGETEELKQEIKEIRQEDSYLQKEKLEYCEKWESIYGKYDEALKNWFETHTEIIPPKENEKKNKVETKIRQKVEAAESKEIVQEKIGTRKEFVHFSNANVVQGMFDFGDDDLKQTAVQQKSQNERTDKKTSENTMLVDISKTKQFTQIDFYNNTDNFREESGFSFDYLHKCGLIPPFTKDGGNLKVLGGDKKEYLMTKAQFSNLLDNTMYYAQNVKKLDVDKLIREKVPEYRRNFVQKEDLFSNGLSARLSRLEEIKNADGNRMGKKEEREKKTAAV